MSEIEGIYAIWLREAKIYMREKERVISSIISPLLWIFAGKVLGGATDAMIQVIFLLVIGFFISVPLTPLVIIKAFLMLLLISIAMVSIGLVIGANLKSPEGFTLVINFVMWPMFFFSGALFPVSNLSGLLYTVTFINPLTYGVDAVRGIILGIHQFPIFIDVAVMLVFAVIAIGIGVMSFRRM
jgi:ABC-2 type transport system permease protein